VTPSEAGELVLEGRRSRWRLLPFLGPAFIAAVAYIDPGNFATNIAGRDVLIVEDVVDTGLTLHYLVRTLELREPASVAAVTLLDRPYRRLVDDLPVRYVGFVVPDELFVGYGFDLDEQWRHLPDLHLLRNLG
jgi:hypoxanthine-guanine phosphoribosyltransferase